MRTTLRWRIAVAICALIPSAAPTPVRAQASQAVSEADLDRLRSQVEILVEQNREMRRTVEGLEREVERARDEARAAEDLARSAATAPARAREGSAPVGSGARNESGPLLSMGSGGGMQLQLLDVSVDVLSSFGGSTARDSELAWLEGGDHDPNQRGFNLQQIELSLQGAVDPYMTGDVHLVYFLDQEGESQFEVEEAFLTSTQLPWGLSEKGFQVEFGQFFTEFGLINPQHPHQWAWQDQPFMLTRLFGGDGMRAPGVRVGWLTPLPWFSEVQVGAQNATGETMVSFLASDEVFEERGIGGRPFAGQEVSGISDLVYLARWVNGFDLSETTSAQIGLSGLLGPNRTGSDGRTIIGGTDFKVKWRPLQTDRGWPFVTFQTEFLYRNYKADDFLGCVPPDEDGGCDQLLPLGGDTLDDWGLYSQILYGFRRGWAMGLRYEYGTGSGENIGELARAEDPFRSDRHRVSPLLAFYPSEFSRLRLQYNYDHTESLEEGDAHSVWAGVEFLFGAHPAHGY